ncbi:hypothetical protein BG000_004638, partial [Podila horticola]
MPKAIILLLALCASTLAAGLYNVEVRNNAGTEKYKFTIYSKQRACWCLKNTQAGSITGVQGGNIKMFSTTDCSGNYRTLGNSSKASSTQWVNSLSY